MPFSMFCFDCEGVSLLNVKYLMALHDVTRHQILREELTLTKCASIENSLPCVVVNHHNVVCRKENKLFQWAYQFKSTLDFQCCLLTYMELLVLLFGVLVLQLASPCKAYKYHLNRLV